MLTNGPDHFAPQTPAHTPFSYFSSYIGAAHHTAKTVTLADLCAGIRLGKWAQPVADVRELAPHRWDRDPDNAKRKGKLAAEYTSRKNRLPYVVLSGTWDPAHRHADGATHAKKPCPVNGIIDPSGLRLIDLDPPPGHDLDAVRADLDNGAVPWAAACWLSAGGDGLHIAAWVTPAPTDQVTSHAAYAALCRDLAIRIPAAMIGNDSSSKNLMRPAFVSHDSAARLRHDAEPLQWLDPAKAAQLPGDTPEGSPGTADPFGPSGDGTKAPAREFSRPGPDADRQLVLLALDALARGHAGEDDNRMLAVMGNMKALGVGFDEFDAWAASAGCTCERRGRWDNPPSATQSDRPGWAIVHLAARRYGFEKPGKPPGDDDAPRFSYYSAGLVGALRHIGYDVRYNSRAQTHQVRPLGGSAISELKTQPPGPDSWITVDDGARAKLLESLAFRSHGKDDKDGNSTRYAIPDAHFTRAMQVIRNDCRVDPWAEWVAQNVPQWDRTERIDTMAHDCWGVLDHQPDLDPGLLAIWGRALMNGLAARLLFPGCPAPTIPVLTGPEGAGKSLGFSFLFPEVWQDTLFSDSLDFRKLADNRSTIEDTGGVMLAEIAEMSQLGGRDLESIKAGITRRRDRARLAYDKDITEVARAFLVVATSNSETPLPDDVTNRRYIPLRTSDDCNATDVMAYMTQHRAQLWAEALHTTRLDPLRHVVQGELTALLGAHNADKVDQVDLVDAIADAIEDAHIVTGTMLSLVYESQYFTRSGRDRDGEVTKTPLSESEVAEKLNKPLQTRVGNALKKRGWTKAYPTGVRKTGGQTYYKPGYDEPGASDF